MSRNVLWRFLVFTGALFLAAGTAQAFYFPWPDSTKHPRVILYADEHIMEHIDEHPAWFRRDFLITGLNIRGASYGHTDAQIQQFENLRNALKYSNIFVGSSISGTTAIHDLNLHQYPANAASIEDMSVRVKYLGPWIRDPMQQVVDLSDVLSRRELQQGILSLWAHVHGAVRLVDNAAVHPQVARMQSWENYCRNIAEIRGMGEAALHINTIFYVFVRPWQMNETETRQLIAAVRGRGGNGIALPLPWSKSLDRNSNGWAIYRYRQMLDAGLTVILVPSDDAPLERMFSWVETWRKPKDRIYYSVPVWEEVPF